MRPHAYAAIENLTGSARQKSTTENAFDIAPNVVDYLRRVLGPARGQPMARANTRARCGFAEVEEASPGRSQKKIVLLNRIASGK